MLKRIIFSRLFLSIAGIIVLSAALFFLIRGIRFAVGKIQTGSIIIPFTTPTPTPEPDDSINILLLGYGGPGHDGPYLTDTMLIARFDPKRNTAFLLSLPRDLWVTLPASPLGIQEKLNAAYAIGLDDMAYKEKPTKYTGGTSGALAMVSDVVTGVTGIPITHVVALDFSGFTKAIDTLGGIDVSVATSFTDKEYPIAGKEKDLCDHKEEEVEGLLKDATSSAVIFPCRYETIEFSKGMVHMDGTTALKYVRSRHSSDGSDFARSVRQREVILAVKQKVLSLGMLAKLPEIYKTIASHVATDITASSIPSFLPLLESWSSYHITSLGISDANVLQQAFTSSNRYALFSIEGEGKWDLMKQYIYDSLRPEKEKKVALIELLGIKSEKSRLETIQSELLKYNVVVTDILYANKEATQSSFLISKEKQFADPVKKGLESVVSPLVVTTSAKTLLYDGILTIAPLPTPTPTIKTSAD